MEQHRMARHNNNISLTTKFALNMLGLYTNKEIYRLLPEKLANDVINIRIKNTNDVYNVNRFSKIYDYI
jgi:hypothetical protein